MRTSDTDGTGLMAVRAIVLGLLTLSLSIGITGCHPPKGACVVGRGVTAGCGEDFTSGQCSILNGRFYEAFTCADLSITTVNPIR